MELPPWFDAAVLTFAYAHADRPSEVSHRLPYDRQNFQGFLEELGFPLFRPPNGGGLTWLAELQGLRLSLEVDMPTRLLLEITTGPDDGDVTVPCGVEYPINVGLPRLQCKVRIWPFSPAPVDLIRCEFMYRVPTTLDDMFNDAVQLFSMSPKTARNQSGSRAHPKKDWHAYLRPKFE